MFNIFTITIPVTGTLAADVDFRQILPVDAQLIHVSAAQSGSALMRFQVGDSADPNEYLGYETLTGSNTVDQYDGDDFLDSDGNTHSRYYPHIAKGTTICVNVDFNYNNGGGASAGADLSVVLTFCEG